MNIYDNGSKIYPDLNPTAPQEPQAYRLKKMTEVEAYLLDEIEERRQQTKKKKKRFLYPSICQQRWPTRWCCLGQSQCRSFPFNDRRWRHRRRHLAH